MQNSKLIRQIVLKAIRLYQQTLSPDHGLFRIFFPFGVCRYEETCSEYTYRLVKEQGMKGLIRGMNRVAHCHPFAKV